MQNALILYDYSILYLCTRIETNYGTSIMSSPIESPPRVPLVELARMFSSEKEAALRELIDKANMEYLYWSKIKYTTIQPPLTPRLLWGYTRETRRAASISIWRRYGITLYTTPYMQGVLYELEQTLRIDMPLSDLIPATSKKQYLLRSIEEEAIRSSQMEGTWRYSTWHCRIPRLWCSRG